MPRLGILQWAKWGLTAPATVGFGILPGAECFEDPDVRIRTGGGGLLAAKGGLWAGGVSAAYYVSGTNESLAATAFRASYPRGALTPVCISVGDEAAGKQFSSCYTSGLTCAWRASSDEGGGGPLVAKQTFRALWVDDVAGSAMIAEPNLDFEDYECVVTLPLGLGGKAEAKASSVVIEVANVVVGYQSGDTKATGYERFPETLLVGQEMVRVRVRALERLAEMGTTVRAAVMDLQQSVGLVFTNSAGNALSLSLGSMVCTADGNEVVGSNKMVEYEYGFGMAQAAVGTLSWLYTAA